ncbi:TRAP transporter small permease [Aquamicrobium sp. LC103]|uniref:TRAP transporter small permease n=1 Tax=Aquamicrobium sp. LC103 TaxID=1120658 RepID=UPI00063E8EAF|nr:TRAP transporter small permease [Aquamicrobium sp. LC103]
MERRSNAAETVGISRALASLEVALMAVSAVAMAAIMLVVTLDATLRYIISSPLTWSYDLIGLYLMVAVFFLALPDTLNHHGHIAVDIFQRLIPLRLRHLLLGTGYALSTWVMVLIVWGAGQRLKTAFLQDERIAALVPWPTWIAYLLVVVGSSVLVMRCLLRVYGHFASAIIGREVVDMPPPPTEAGVEEI